MALKVSMTFAIRGFLGAKIDVAGSHLWENVFFYCIYFKKRPSQLIARPKSWYYRKPTAATSLVFNQLRLSKRRVMILTVY